MQENTTTAATTTAAITSKIVLFIFSQSNVDRSIPPFVDCTPPRECVVHTREQRTFFDHPRSITIRPSSASRLD